MAKVQAGVYSAYRVHDRVGIDCSDAVEPSKTRQEFADECDINKIMERYDVSAGLIPFPDARQEPRYFDCSEVPDLQSAMNGIMAAEEAFMTLPAKVRAEFENDPVRFVEFACDPENLDQMRDWKLAPPAPEIVPEKVQKVEVVNPPKED